MLRAKNAERFLCLVTTPPRAAAIVGDLLELHDRRASFWFAVAQTAWGLSRRFRWAFFGALLVELVWLLFLLLPSQFTDGWNHALPPRLEDFALPALVCWTLLAASAVFASIRFGPRAPISRLAIALAILSSFELFL